MYEYVYNDELQHYGVLGMKWGVRRASRAYARATTKEDKAKAYARIEKHMSKADKKLKKIDNRIQKHQQKSAKALKKSDNFLDPFRNHHKAKATRQGRKATKQMRKAEKWTNQMEKAFKQSTKSLNAEQIAIGKKYAESLKLRTTRSMGY